MIRHNVWFGFFVHYVFVYPQSWMKVFDMLQRERKIVLRVSFDLWSLDCCAPKGAGCLGKAEQN